jgi:putative adenylate-forming enzyme
MNLGFILRVLNERRALRGHEGWSRADIDRHQEAALAELRLFAVRQSRFYQRFHAGLEGRPLGELPVLTKGELMEHFDELVTDPEIRLSDVRSFLTALDGDRLYRGRYRVAQTAGSTGRPGIFLSSPTEWTTVVASYARAQEWAGITVDLLHRTRLAVVSSRTPWHQSAMVGASVDSPFVPVRRFDATSPLEEIVAGLNAWRPENLICYSSMGRALADEQLAGRLSIAPRAVMCSSEVLTAETRRRIRIAFGVEPFAVYAATEPAGIASECAQHRLHLFEDLVITEIVDDANRPVPVGEPGAKVLVTVLFSRTQPLIRYEMSDIVSAAEGTCECGRAFALLASVEGRAEESLTFPGVLGGSVSVHPNVFHRVLEPLPVRQWQVGQNRAGIVVRVVPGPESFDDQAVLAELTRELGAAGAAPPSVRLERVGAIPKTAAGKMPLIRREPG